MCGKGTFSQIRSHMYGTATMIGIEKLRCKKTCDQNILYKSMIVYNVILSDRANCLELVIAISKSFVNNYSLISTLMLSKVYESDNSLKYRSDVSGHNFNRFDVYFKEA